MTGLISKRQVLADRWRLEVQDKCDWSLLVSTTCVSGWIDRGSSPTVREGSVIFLRLGRSTVRKGSAFPAGSSFYLSLEAQPPASVSLHVGRKAGGFPHWAAAKPHGITLKACNVIGRVPSLDRYPHKLI